MRSRVLQHFIAGSSWTPRVRRIEWQRTAGELGALLREAALVKELDPVYNRQLRRPGQLCGFAFDGRRLRLARGEEIDAETLPFVYGLWRSRAAAMAALRAAADEHRLCLQVLGLRVWSASLAMLPSSSWALRRACAPARRASMCTMRASPLRSPA